MTINYDANKIVYPELDEKWYGEQNTKSICSYLKHWVSVISYFILSCYHGFYFQFVYVTFYYNFLSVCSSCPPCTYLYIISVNIQIHVSNVNTYDKSNCQNCSILPTKSEKPSKNHEYYSQSLTVNFFAHRHEPSFWEFLN